MPPNGEEGGRALELDPVIHQPIRMRIMAALHKNRQLDFATIRDALHVTPGNLGNHLERLETAGYIHAAREFNALGFAVRYRITQQGSEKFRAYISQLRELLENIAPESTES